MDSPNIKKEEKNVWWRASSPVPMGSVIMGILLGLLLVQQSVTIYLVTIRPLSVCSSETSTKVRKETIIDYDFKGLLHQIESTMVKAQQTDCNMNATVSKKLLEQLKIFNEKENIYMYNQNSTELLLENSKKLSDIAETLSFIKESIANLKTTNEGIKHELLELYNNTENGPLASCQDLKKNQLDSPSGYYHINSQIVYCEMGTLCNSTEGGWTRLAYLNMSDATVDCPDGWLLYQTGGIRACGRPDTGGGSCASVKFFSKSIKYSEVCGRVVGYQYGSPDGTDTRFTDLSIHNDINSYYVDGVSITRGYPRNHVWTLMGGLSDSYNGDTKGQCPCNTPPGDTLGHIQSFVGNDYFCESGTSSAWNYQLFTNDPLWDGQGCGTLEGNCCAAPGLPWFHKALSTPTNDYLELRVCGDQGTRDEDTPLGLYEIYVK